MRIQAVIGGYGPEAVTLVGVLDADTGVLVVAKQIAHREERVKEDFAIVSNLRLPEVDFTFRDDHVESAIRSYFDRRAQGLVEIESEAARFTPDHKIEADGINETGRKYRMAPDIAAGQVAVLAMVAFVDAQSTIGAITDMLSDLDDLYRVISI